MTTIYFEVYIIKLSKHVIISILNQNWGNVAKNSINLITIHMSFQVRLNHKHSSLTSAFCLHERMRMFLIGNKPEKFKLFFF